MALRLIGAVMCACLALACGGRSPAPSAMPDGGSAGAPAQPVPRTITPADSGRVFTMEVGQTAGLVVPDPAAPDPEVDGTSVLVIEVVNIQASGRREWELRAVEPGRTRLTAKGARPYTVTLDVRPPRAGK